jgi:regulator of protease activity HflC (stomatin/prohibitin superfamily)
MLGLLFALAWLALFLSIAVNWKLGEMPTIRAGAAGQKPQLDLGSPLKPTLRSATLLAIGLGLAPFWFVFGNNCMLTIPPAHVAVVFDPLRGGIQPNVLPEGFHVVMPWWETQSFSQQTQEYTSQQTQEYTMSGSGGRPTEGAVAGEGSIRCQTNEGMNVEIDCTVLFHVDPKAANDVWSKLGEDTLRLIVRPYTHNVMRMVVAKYSVEDVYTTKRKEIETEIVDQMRPLFQEKGLVLEQILVRNVQYGNPAFADAINAKQVAQQQVQTEAQKLNRAKIEKQTTIAQAQGEASAIAARGATLRANPEVVQYEFVQKVAPRLKSMYLPASALPIPRGGQ